MQHSKPSTTFCKFLEEMAATAPVAIGTRGTVGSLVKKEIDYFAKIEFERCSGNDMASSSRRSSSPPTFWHTVMSWRRKKKRIGNRFITKICSAFDVSGSNRLNKISGFNYTILQNDFNSLHM
ncbi:uncharacterized protein LOC111010862 [Momordica charantia]|uniref:Uncharacterized protein LOC111010862 n=1 Tax=Momordica charantia TaxID=3673 RepID=A0A6J1CHB1_MOMCH|nr:uncharacterized protein LOC111010862 [Momordica charantia]